ncbi:MAG: DUF362 domain-containing protein [Clostridia bacterium]|nr:DUF362 domain-containing protein [Clostridia bacterium]
MEQSKVYFSDLHTESGNGLLVKFKRLIQAAGIENIDFENKFTAVKVHFGEPGNLAFLRSNWAKVVCDLVKEKGGKPFMTDCNTLYVGGRKNALDHLDSAYENGYTPFSTGCQIIIADGLRGLSETMVPVNGGEYVKEAKIGDAIMEADVFISLTHFKGHELTGFGGAIKNIGMGCGSQSGKMEMHNQGTPKVNANKCIACGLCVKNCAHEGVIVIDGLAVIQEDHCVGCGRCIGVCPVGAMSSKWDESNEILSKKMAEYAWAVLNGRPSFHISLVIDVSPNCDCDSQNDIPIIPNVGMFASFDSIALDQACVDAVNAQSPIQGSQLCSAEHSHADHFKMIHPDSEWEACLAHGEKLGIGSRKYELINVK